MTKTYQFALFDGEEFHDGYTSVYNDDYKSFLDFLEEQLYVLYELTPITRQSWRDDMARYGNCLFTYHGLEDVVVALKDDTIIVADLEGQPLYAWIIENRFTGELDHIIGVDIECAFRDAGLCRAEYFIIGKEEEA